MDNVPPHSTQAEIALIGGVLLDADAYERIYGTVQADDFWDARHKVMWSCIETIMEQGKPLDVVTLAEALQRGGKLEEAGGLPYLGAIRTGTSSTANVRAYAQAIREHSVMRSLIKSGAAQIDAVHNPNGRSSQELLEEAQTALATLAERGVLGAGWVSAREATHSAITRIEKLWQAGTGMVGVSSGFADLDKITRGLEAGTLIILAARPAMGKTTLAMNIAQHVAATDPRHVAVFSLEMSSESLAMRLMSSLGNIDHDHLRSAQLNDDDLAGVTLASNKLGDMRLCIDDQSGLTVGEIEVRAKRLHREKGGLSLIVIDYLGLIGMSAKVENQNLGIAKITAALKGLAKTLNVPVVLLSQLNREVEKRPNKRPLMADLRDSGSIEQDADLVAFIYRDEVYHPDTQDAGIAEILISKQRNGPTGTVRLVFQGQHCRFANLAHEWRPQPTRSRYDNEY